MESITIEQLPKNEKRYKLLVTFPRITGNPLSAEGIALENQNNVSIKTTHAIGEKLKNNSPIEDIVLLIDVLVDTGTLNWSVKVSEMYGYSTMLYYVAHYMKIDNFKTYAALVRYSLEKGANPGILCDVSLTSAAFLYDKLLMVKSGDEDFVDQYEDELYDLLGNMINKAPNCANETYKGYGYTGDTTLHCVGRQKNEKLFVFLAKRGADLETKNTDGSTSLEAFAKAGGDCDTLVKRLEKEGVTVTSQALGVSNRFRH